MVVHVQMQRAEAWITVGGIGEEPLIQGRASFWRRVCLQAGGCNARQFSEIEIGPKLADPRPKTCAGDS